MEIAKLRSDYDPDTFMRIVISDDSDVSLAIYGKGEMKLAGFNGGGLVSGKRDIISAFRKILNILNEEAQEQ